MKTSTRWIVVVLVLSLAPGTWLKRAVAVTDEEFRALQQQTQQQGEEIKDLKKDRAEDQQEIQRLKEKVGETEQKATETQKKADEAQKTATEVAAKVQPVGPVPSEEAAAKHNFLVTGFLDVNYHKTDGENGSFLFGHFNTLFLFRASDKVLFEGELEFELAKTDGGAETEVVVEYAQMDYLFNDHLTLIAGRFLMPLGVFREKLDAQWVNKLSSGPLAEEDETALIPEHDIGVQARGAFYVCDPLTFSYALFVANGPGSVIVGPDEVLQFNDNVEDNSGTPSGGGRLALFYPWEAHHDIEVGVSGQTGTWNNDDDLLWSAFVVDAALHLGPNLELRGEYINTWQETSATATIDRNGGWAQVAYKLAGLNLELPMINNVEAVFRYSGETIPEGRLNQYVLGFIYHVTNTLQVKGSYEINQSNNPDFDADGFSLQAVYGY